MSQKIKCLIVDDEPLAQRIIEKYAEDISTIEIVCKCNNAFEAMQALNDNEIDLIFLDINMPRMNGWSFLEEYQKLHNAQQGKAVIVMLTTSLNPDDVEQSRKFTEISEFRSKPMTHGMLLEIIDKYFP